MATKTTQNPETTVTKTTQATETTAKRTRKVVKWESAFDAFTCEMFGLLMENKDKDLSIVMRKYQLCLRSICEMVKTAKRGQIQNEIDNLDLALTVAGITDKTVVERLNELVALFR